ncbi:uncharacterized protein EDB93DRAFT_92398 [Suillus bovinus]|uniref:uncharacterized protein n=1 Tax=Suillus bovinus TaxID=48563 RepID=UPI001B863985|nr:uncharacterized protein EDB93DRAFT_92398 [Suillus bovinus]KAG2155242.1 hypothetical protein EDB93DRAFT_92398 [Suillus bovinus]
MNIFEEIKSHTWPLRSLVFGTLCCQIGISFTQPGHSARWIRPRFIVLFLAGAYTIISKFEMHVAHVAPYIYWFCVFYFGFCFSSHYSGDTELTVYSFSYISQWSFQSCRTNILLSDFLPNFKLPHILRPDDSPCQSSTSFCFSNHPN